ncbi:cytochrome P450 4C1-like isoform X2 [Anoplolepis gracilipes]|uniref:cytochrome P450 4C1-like isoform X2 n=1 Tax=Anoplolepis gracilipes TaxID=354296 RepID=UPI003BA0113A
MIVTTILILCIFTALIYYYHLHYGRNGRLINLIPGPSTYPFLGNILALLGSPVDLWNVRRKILTNYYPISKIWVTIVPIINVAHPNDIETILSSTKHIEKGSVYAYLFPWFGTGLLTSTGTKWHNRRKILTPTFHFNILRQFVNIFIEEGDRMTKSLKNKQNHTVENLISFISEHTLNAICETAMGTSLQSMNIFQKQYRDAVYDMINIIAYRIVRPWLKNETVFALTSKGRMHNKILKILHGFTKKIIEERKRYHEETGYQYLKNFENDTPNEYAEIATTRKKRLAMLDLLIAASQENKIDDSGIREEVDTFMFEDRVRNEVNAALQENGGNFTMSLLQNLPYLERCLKEALRLYPSVPFISRTLSADTTLSSYVVPSGTTVDLHIYEVHRDPNFWPNPDIFDPDRFLPEKTRGRHSYSYVPFSAGSRNCIGQRFAMLELKAIIAPLLHNFYLEPLDYLKNLQIRIDLVTRPAHPIRLNFIPIQ